MRQVLADLTRDSQTKKRGSRTTQGAGQRRRRTTKRRREPKIEILTSPNAPLPMTLTVLKSLKPIFVRRSLKNCDCVRICLLISRSRRSSGTPASDLSSSAPLHSTTQRGADVRPFIVTIASHRGETERNVTVHPSRAEQNRNQSIRQFPQVRSMVVSRATYRTFKSIAVSSATR